MEKSHVRRMTVSAMMGTIAFVLMYFSFSVPFLSPFAEFDFSALPELIGGYLLGPLGAIVIIVIKLTLKLVFKGTTSMFVGELQNLVLSLAYVLPAILYYKRNKTKKNAMIGLVIGSACSIVLAIITSLYAVFPAYMELYGMDWNAIVSTCSAVNPWIKDIPTMVVFSVIPFNVVSRAVTSVITLLVYKRLCTPLKKLIRC